MKLEETTQTSDKVAKILGVKWATRLSAATRPWLRMISYAPFRWMRLAGLRAAQAKIGQDILLEPGVEVLSPWRLSIGSHNNIGRHVHLDARGYLTIGNNVNISDEVAVWTAEHSVQAADFALTKAPVIVEDRVWICFRSIILPGVTLGEGCVVAAGAVVTKDVPPFSLVGGSPAKVIGSRTKDLMYQCGKPRY